MQTGPVLRFAPFHLDPQNARLWCGKQVIDLTPKAFAVLCHLVEHAGQLVTKEALLTAVWPEIYVSEGVLSECVREIRKALGDTPQAPRFIQTVHGRGYRFIGKVVSSQRSVARRRKQRERNWQLTTHLVGREPELAQLQKWLKRALDGTRQLVFITGEAGIGKTSLVEAFLFGVRSHKKFGVSKPKPRTLNSELPSTSSPWIGRGQCIDHYGQGEAYLPVLEALGRMCREPEGNQLIDLLSQHAPTWLVQMPALLTTTDLEALQRRTQGVTRERMLRELAEAVEVLSAEHPLVLVLEDLHWSDVSTLDLLAFVARRREPARLLIIGAYRPVEVIVGDHSLKSVKQELQLHEQCVELPLTFLTEEHVAKYLVRRFASPPPASAGKACPERGRRGQGKGFAPATLHKLAQLIHQRTEGNPLFLVNLVDYLVSQGGLVRIDGQWRLQGEVTAVASWAPQSLQQMIEKQIERLSSQDQRVLEVASVAGAEFSAAAVAAGAGIEIETVEEQCGELARHEQLLRPRGTADWPDGTVTARYSFLHALYQDVLYGRLTARRRQRLHQQIGEREEQGYGERAREIAAELAVHFEQGRDYRRAIQYLQQAGEKAVQRSAHQEAITQLTKGLELLKTLPDTPERTQQELTLQINLGPALAAIKGTASPEVEQVYTRARELCRQVGETPQLFLVLLGLSSFYQMRAEYPTARELAEQCFSFSLALKKRRPTALMWAHIALGQTLFFLGEFTQAQEHLEEGIVLYNSQKDNPLVSRAPIDPRMQCLSFAALILWHLGYPDQALKRNQEALTLAQELHHPLSLANTLVPAAMLHQLRREGQTAQEWAEAALTLSAEQGFSQYFAFGAIYRGWALVDQGWEEEGTAQIRQGVAADQASGGVRQRSYYLALLAEAYGKTKQPTEGLNVLAEALDFVQKTGERRWEAELYRLAGELLLRRGEWESGRVGERETFPHSSDRPFPHSSPEECFRRAIKIARKQQAKSLELRAVMSLSRLRQQQGKKKQGHKMLSEIYGWFTEGFDTKDLQEAKALLEELSR